MGNSRKISVTLYKEPNDIERAYCLIEDTNEMWGVFTRNKFMAVERMMEEDAVNYYKIANFFKKHGSPCDNGGKELSKEAKLVGISNILANLNK